MNLRKIVTAALCVFALAAPALAEPVAGPAKVDIKDADASLQLPQGYAFLPKAEAQKLLEDSGSTGEGAVGIIIPMIKRGEETAFYVVCRFEDSGYVSDDDANKLNADEILNQYKEGTKEQNEIRKEKDLPPVYVTGWAEKPHYDKAQHHVVWAIQAKDQDSAEAPVSGINYNTRILGRRGVLSLNLVTSPETLEEDKKAVSALLNSTTFNKGAEYKDYIAGKDKSAGYGLAGLILGGGAMAAAAKLGLLGGLWKWILGLVLVFKKFAIVLIAAGGAAVSKFFKRGSKPSETAASVQTPPENPPST